MATRTDYIPRAHTDFYVWQNTFYEYLLTMYETFGIAEESLTALSEIRAQYEVAFEMASNKSTANKADRLLRNKTEDEYVKAIRGFVATYLRNNPKVSDSDRALLHLTIRDRTYTRAAVPTSSPLLRVRLLGSCGHLLRFKDSHQESRRKPAGVKTCEIRYAISEKAPKTDSEWLYAGSSSNGSFKMYFDFSQRGKRVFYQARWVNTRSEPGGWGNVAEAVVA